MTKILLVEDDKSLREIYGVRLLAEGYDIVSAGDGEEALAMAIKERPELIVSDVMMPKISGFDMLDILRSTTETKDIKVIMMTALSSEDQRARGEALGADRYLVKSQVGIEDVVRTVHDVLGDALTPQPAATQAFAPPPPSALPRTPAPTYTTPPEPTAPTMQQAAPLAPQQPIAQPAPAPAAAPVAPAPVTPPQQVITPVTPVSHAMAPAPEPSLPLPTAPFSTPRPASLGDRVINPIVQPVSDQPDIASMMSHELDMEAAPATPAPAPQPQFAPQAPASTPESSSTFTVPTAPAASSFAQPGAMHGATNITFEETPLPPSAATQGQPPAPAGDTTSTGGVL